jgi:hypothetical protein
VIRWISKVNEGENEKWGRLSAIKLASQKHPAGRYFYLVMRTAFRGITNREQFQYTVMNMDTGLLIRGTEAEAIVNELINEGESLFPGALEGLAQAIEKIRKDSGHEIGKAQNAFQEDQNSKYQIRKDQMDRFFERKIETQRQRILSAEITLQAKGKGEAAGFRAFLDRLQQEYQEQSRRLKSKMDKLEFKFSEVAGGYFEVCAHE